MGPRIGLILLQALGAISLLPYPFILIANVMSIAAEGQTLRGAVPFVLLSLYPALWIVLDVLSWRAMGRGSMGWAFTFASVPVAASLTGIGLWAASSHADDEREKARLKAFRAQIEAANPLAWSLMCFYGPARYRGTVPLPLDVAIEAIRASQHINDPVPEYGTPLRIALWNLKLKWDGTPSGERSQESLRIVRALVAHGARLSADERTSLRDVARLKLAMLDKPVEAELENPLVWKIVKSSGGAAAELDAEDAPLLNKATKLYGTPLLASLLLLDSGTLAGKLIDAGARLSPEEERDPAGARALADLFRDRPDFESVYRK